MRNVEFIYNKNDSNGKYYLLAYIACTCSFQSKSYTILLHINYNSFVPILLLLYIQGGPKKKGRFDFVSQNPQYLFL